MTTVNLDEQTAQALEKLRRQAAALGIPLDRYLADLADAGERNSNSVAVHSPHRLSQAEFRQWLADVSAGMPALPPLPIDFSR